MSLTVLASMLAARLTPCAQVQDTLLEKVAHFIGCLLALYLYLRFWDALSMTYTYALGRSEGLSLLTGGTLSFNFWFGEILLGTLLPLLLLLNPKTRRHSFWRMFALALAVGGVVAYRWDTNLSGLMILVSYLPGAPQTAYTMYRPSLVEGLVGLGIISYGLLLFSLRVRYFKVVYHRPPASLSAD